MRDIPECLNRRYQALDDLIGELTSVMSNGDSNESCLKDTDDASIKLMCDIWNILKEDPCCDLPKSVQERVDLAVRSSRSFGPSHVSCYMAGKESCCSNSKKQQKEKSACCSSKSASPKSTSDSLPLSKVLCNLKEAISFDKKCNDRISELTNAQRRLKEQIHELESREKDGAQLLKQAECMWTCMEDAYKAKIAESLERQNSILRQMKEIETSNTKWRKNKKDIEFQLSNVDKCYQEIREKIQEKNNDIKCIKIEVENLKKRLSNSKNETEAINKTLAKKTAASQAKVASLQAEIHKMKTAVIDEQKAKNEKEYEGNQYIKDAREDLQKIYRVFLEKKLENEDLRAEKQALLEEIELLNKTSDQCKEKCQKNSERLASEITKIDSEIAGFKVRCIKCHQCIDTADVRKFCTDCPRCQEEKECLYKDGQCTPDVAMDCVCMATKQKFMDNVFENMNTILERQIKTAAGKSVANAVLSCLRKSRNGKLNDETRKLLQKFVLSAVRKNLTLTIIGGAVKTRCEMDPDTYKQLMLCLKNVKVVQPPKEDKGTISKKDPCRRWGGMNECNCPKGPKNCVCSKKAPPPPSDPEPCPPEPPQDKDDIGEMALCPHKESTACGPDCGMKAVPSAVGTDVAAWKQSPCDPKHCKFTTNMRAAQCVLGPDSLGSSFSMKGFSLKVPIIPESSFLDTCDNKMVCNSGPDSVKPCTCSKESNSHPRERIIEEVMGRYIDVTPIEKVTVDQNVGSNMGRWKNRHHLRENTLKEFSETNTSKKRKPQPGVCLSYYILESHPKKTWTCRMKIHRRDISVFKNKKNTMMWSKYQIPRHKKLSIDAHKNCKKYSFNGPCEGSNEIRLSSFCVVNSRSSYSTGSTTGDINPENVMLKNSLKRKETTKILKALIKSMPVDQLDEAQTTREIEWVTAKSLFKKLSSLLQTIEGDIAKEEIELKSENTFDENQITEAKSQTKSFVKISGNNSLCSSATNTLKCVYLCDSFTNISNQSNKSDLKQKRKRVVKCSKKTCSKILRRTQKTKETNGEKCFDTAAENQVEDWTRPYVLNEDKLTIVEIADSTEEEGGEYLKEDDTGYIKKYTTKLRNTSSGTILLELDEAMVFKIKRKIEQSKLGNIPISLKQTSSGHCLVNLNPTFTSDDAYLIKKTSSDGLILENDKNAVNVFNDKTVLSSNVPLASKPEFKNILHNDVNTATTSKQFTKNKYPTYVTIGVKKNDGTLDLIEATLGRTNSGEEILFLGDSLCVRQLLSTTTECPVLLLKSRSDKFILHTKSTISNARLRVTTSGRALLFEVDPEIFKLIHIHMLHHKQKLHPNTHELYKLKLVDSQQNIRCPPAVLKATSSINYKVVLDKEYERLYRQKMVENLDYDYECPIEFTKTKSGSIVIKFADNETNNRTPNAALVRSPSGNINIEVKNSTRQKDSLQSNTKSFTSDGKPSSRLFFSILNQVTYQKKSNPVNHQIIHTKKSSSESNLFEKIKSSFQNQQSLFTQPTTVIKKTSSGQYALVLDKEPKKAFLNQLKSYLSHNTQGLIPVKRSEFGEISIIFDKQKDKCNSLKITPSGNIYVLVDERYVNVAPNSMASDESNSGNDIPELNVNIDDKCVTTCCNAAPQGTSCDASKCVCESLFKSGLNQSDKSTTSFRCSTEESEGQICKGKSCLKTERRNLAKRDKSPHIVIKPSPGGPNFRKRKMGSNQQIFYLEESVCSFHKDRYNSVSNELLEISGLCNKSRSISYKGKRQNFSSVRKNNYQPSSSNSSAYLDYLPPQLPPFLKDLQYN